MSYETRFELEQQIMQCWNVVDDVLAVYYASETLSEDELQNALLGVHQLYSIKFNQMFSVFEKLCGELNNA